MSRKLFVMLIVWFSGFLCFAQNSQKVSEILNKNEVTKGDAAYFTCVYKNLCAENAVESDAFAVLQGNAVFDFAENANEVISLSKACYLIAKTSDMKGGIFYSIFKNKRYAFREFKALGIIPNTSDPDSKVTGAQLIALFNGFEQKGKTK